ncbi:NAD(P)-dependent dehydrogenase (short-subunit alcohol dehydrogenase family) [Paenibacillus sp. SORGH_AS306]|uniref:oxidoreductase n=1 Tax=unclassified Paenibacillus TaxID=185978 RepID=UPI002785AA07|nr:MULTISPECIES: oxidoreductase [unclassified Paenibacillus]MDQ1233832.1 NAD(P)-dependent dehydrogenase (short-subunit alcohol dehydrogenase family) [Paenibacillus sp. SORGH_AS_0306]MDR6110878.1 NAD(P)-dependent dehydrogenase (short-subunit alcohol dehydrogenase family) [Paenibacillus sp. SORGH_AS_0338]
MTTHWDELQVPDMQGKTIVITGANSGIGYEAATILAGRGAEIVMAVRNYDKGQKALQAIQNVHPSAKLQLMRLDLSELASIRHFAEEFRQNHHQLSILINNAGVMMPPYSRTQDGFELQFGSNHLGHFALTGLLLPQLLATPHARIVTLSSIAAYAGKIDFDNLDGSKGYRSFKFYSQSKLANMLFARELQLRLAQHQVDTISVACHPGFTHTNLASRGSGKPVSGIFGLLSRSFGQKALMGALPTLYAATSPTIHGGEYVGPDGKGGRKGYPKLDDHIDKLYQADISQRLWTLSESLTGVQYEWKQPEFATLS